jgi:predicted outer membrane repeat protein
MAMPPRRRPARAAFLPVCAAALLVLEVLAPTAGAHVEPPVPTPPGVGLLDVQCSASAESCIAVGSSLTDGVVATVSREGVVQQVRQVPGTSVLSGVACPSPTSCLAVGYDGPGFSDVRANHAVVVPIAAGVPGAVQAETSAAWLNGASCTSTSLCYAVGTSFSPLSGVAVKIVDGSVTERHAVTGLGELHDVSCYDATSCVAVGQAAAGGGVVLPLSDGAPDVPRLAPGSATLFGITCPGPSCRAVGMQLNEEQTMATGVVVEVNRGNATGSTLVPGTSELRDVDCASLALCEAVGTDAAVGIYAGEPGPREVVGGAQLNGLACLGPTACLAVGSNAVVPVAPLEPRVVPVISGVKQAGSDLAFFEVETPAPPGFHWEGQVVCTETTDGPIDGQLALGEHQIEGSSCSGLSAVAEPDPEHPDRQTYLVTTYSGGTLGVREPVVLDVPCDSTALIDAMVAARATAGGTLTLASGCNYELTAPWGTIDGIDDGLPPVRGELTVHGAGATIARRTDDGTPEFRLLRVLPRSTVDIDHVTLTGGATPGDGGAILGDGEVRLSGSTIRGNRARNGGGIQLMGPSVLNGTTFEGNEALGIGGATHGNGGAVNIVARLSSPAEHSITDSTFVGNTAHARGGAIYNDAPLHLTNVTITDNTSGFNGGAIYADDFTWLDQATVVGNHSNPSYGGAIAVFFEVFAHGLLVAENRPFNCVAGPFSPSPVQAFWGEDHNIEDRDQCGLLAENGSVSNSTTIGLQPLADNGGPTATMAIDETSSAWHLVPADGCPATDQRGISRPQPPGATHCSAGAFEPKGIQLAAEVTGRQVYGGAASLEATVDGTPLTGVHCTTVDDGTPIDPALPAGEHTIDGSSCSGGDVGPNEYVSTYTGTFVVDRAPLTVTADDATRAYGQPNPAFSASYDGLVNGETPAALDRELTFATSAGPGSDVGTYAVTPGGLTSSNYAITFAPGTLTVTDVASEVTLTATPPASSELGQPVAWTAAVAVADGGAGQATGEVRFVDADLGTVLGVAQVTDGQAQLVAPAGPLGPRRIRAEYAGDGNVRAGTAEVQHEVLPITTRLVAHDARTPLPVLGATLTSVTTGRAVAGAQVDFVLHGRVVCRGTTDARGTAQCRPGLVVLLLGHLDYEARFGGVAGATPSSATGQIHGLLG